jgi:hypothetical protein
VPIERLKRRDQIRRRTFTADQASGRHSQPARTCRGALARLLVSGHGDVEDERGQRAASSDPQFAVDVVQVLLYRSGRQV